MLAPEVLRTVERQRAGTITVAGRLSAVLAALWARVSMDDPMGSWAAVAPAAEGAFVAAQAVTAGMADGYVKQAATLQGFDLAGLGSVEASAFAGVAASGLDLATLLAVPAARAGRARSSGAPVRDARSAGGAALEMYARTEVADAARNAAQVAMAAQGVSGYVRHVGSRCCGRCAVLAGRWYRTSASFARHPRCSCSGVPSKRGSSVQSPEALFREGRITDLTAVDRKAVEAGADLSQVVNAKRGVYVAGGEEFTRAGTTRRGVAGARLLTQRIAQTSGAPAGDVFTQFTVSRREVAEAVARYGPLMRRGLPFQRRTEVGTQTVSGYLYAAGRPTVASIFRNAASDDEALRALINTGYLLRPAPEAVARLRAS